MGNHLQEKCKYYQTIIFAIQATIKDRRNHKISSLPF